MQLSLSPDDVVLAQHGDARALDRVVRACSPLIQSILKRLPMSDEDREDALQNSMVRVIRALGSYRREARFTTWLYRLVVNEALMLMRKTRLRRTRSVDVPVEELLEQSAGEVDDTRSLDQKRMRAALEELPAHYRAALLAHYADGRELREMAQRESESESAVRARVHRARQLLRQRMGVEVGSGSTARAA